MEPEVITNLTTLFTTLIGECPPELEGLFYIIMVITLLFVVYMFFNMLWVLFGVFKWKR